MGRDQGPRGGFPPYRPNNRQNTHSQRASFDVNPSIWSSPTFPPPSNAAENGDRPSTTSSGSNDWAVTIPNQMAHTRNGTNGSSPRSSVLAYQSGGMDSMRRPSYENGFGATELAGRHFSAGAFSLANAASSGSFEMPQQQGINMHSSFREQHSPRSSVVTATSSFSQTWNSNANRGSVGDSGVQTNASWLPSTRPAEAPTTSTERPAFASNLSNPWNSSLPSTAASARPFTALSPTAWDGGSVNAFQAGLGFSDGNGFTNGNVLANGNGAPTVSGYDQSMNGHPTGNVFQSGHTHNVFTDIGFTQQSRSSFSQTAPGYNHSAPANFDRRASSQSFAQQPQLPSNLPLNVAMLQQPVYNFGSNLGMAAAYTNSSLPVNGLTTGANTSRSQGVRNSKLREYLNSSKADLQKWDLEVRLSIMELVFFLVGKLTLN